MTQDEIEIAMAIRPGLVTYLPAIQPKRFARDMANRAVADPGSELTANQRRYLCSVAIRYRRQISAATVAKARALLAEIGTE